MAIWDGLEEFAAVARTGSFTEAARQLNVSTSHISRRIQGLEDRLGVKLLSRTTRRVRLTEAGMEYRSKVDDLIAAVEDANEAVSGARADLAGHLRVTSAGPFAERNVLPRLLRFAQQHPRLALTADFNNRYVDLIEEGYDFAIRYGTLTDSSMIARRLATRRLACAASPDYLERNGTPTTPQELKNHSCLATNNDTWVFRDPVKQDAMPIKVRGRLRSNSIPLMCTALERGIGIVYSAMENIQHLVDDGKAVLILAGYEDHARSHWIVYPDRRLMPRRVRAAIDFLLDEFAAERQ